ncbi:MAG TPA: cytochrome P450 [Candidatus Angelobacter sp.]|nr:cytochrome P450 [Candidatus Angelobacter sp.]
MGKYKFPPGPKAVPLFGNSLSYRKDRLEYLTQLYQDYGPAATMHLGSAPAVQLCRPSAIREVFIDKADKFGNRDVMLNMPLIMGDLPFARNALTPKAMIDRCCGCATETSLLALEGELHDSQRQAMLKAFHGPALDKYREIMISQTDRAVKDWEGLGEIELTHEIQALTASVLFKTLFGVDIQDESHHIVKAYRHIVSHSKNVFRPHSKDSEWEELMKVVNRIVADASARNARHADPNSTMLIDLILRASPDGHDGELVRGLVLFFMAAGHVTVSGAIIWAFGLLAQHPQVMAKVMEELQSVLNGRAPEITDLPKLAYLDWVIKETLRLYPPVWVHFRRALEDVEVDGWHLPKGAFVMFSQWVTHRAKEYFERPTEFIPERFAPKTDLLHTPGAYYPFGIGHRACLGTGFTMLETKVVLARALQRFKPVILDARELEHADHYVLLQPKGKVRMKLEALSSRHAPEMVMA